MMLRVTWKVAPDDPKNQFVICPTFRHQLGGLILGGPEYQGLVDDMVTAIKGWQSWGAGGQVQVKAYDLQGTPPNYPKATAENAPGTLNNCNAPPQLACCLSFYGATNQPRKRGRLYIPGAAITGTASETGSGKPSVTVRNKVAALVPIFANLGGANVDWGVWSRVNNTFTRAENWWVDDSWDIIRTRKLKATTRDKGTTSG
jgi:hypothetical protein